MSESVGEAKVREDGAALSTVNNTCSDVFVFPRVSFTKNKAVYCPSAMLVFWKNHLPLLLAKV